MDPLALQFRLPGGGPVSIRDVPCPLYIQGTLQSAGGTVIVLEEVKIGGGGGG